MTEKALLNFFDYVEEIIKLAALTQTDLDQINKQFRQWHTKEVYQLVTWREAMNLCATRAAMGDPMPWEAKDD